MSNSIKKGPEIFASIQGEGINIGRPSAFLRLAQCNLTCSWCDTKYTWDWRNFDIHVETKKMNISEIGNAIDYLGMSRLVITGGEPLIQQDNLLSLTALLHDKGYALEIETNGTIFPDDKLLSMIECWNVSPKISNSLVEFEIRIKKNVLKQFAKLSNAYFKFVIQRKDDILEAEELADNYKISREKIFLMPEGNTAEKVNSVSEWLIPFCANGGYRYTPRLHILLWGDERGR